MLSLTPNQALSGKVDIQYTQEVSILAARKGTPLRCNCRKGTPLRCNCKVWVSPPELITKQAKAMFAIPRQSLQVSLFKMMEPENIQLLYVLYWE